MNEKIKSKNILGVTFVLLLIIGATLLIFGMHTDLKGHDEIKDGTKDIGLTLTNYLQALGGHKTLFDLHSSIGLGAENYKLLLYSSLAGAYILIFDLFVLILFILTFFKNDIKKFIEKVSKKSSK